MLAHVKLVAICCQTPCLDARIIPMNYTSCYRYPCCSIQTSVKGVMFYDGKDKINPRTFAKVIFERDYSNSHHEKAVYAKLEDSGEILGHVKWELAESFCSLMEITGIKILGSVSSYI